MNRSPLFYPLSRGSDAEAGGAADLQTDIMRFMAILALCLVAVFALVQSIPLAPVAPETAEPQRRAASPPVEAPVSEPASPAPSADAPETLQPAAEPAPVAASPEDSVEPATVDAEPDTATVERGFTLRFASDSALTRLVARNEIGVYAIAGKRAQRMSVNRGQYAFWPASMPDRYHEMDPQTVPEAVVDALRRSGAAGAGDTVAWGVTLPTGMRRQLDGYLAEHEGGSLIIEPDGNLEYEP